MGRVVGLGQYVTPTHDKLHWRGQVIDAGLSPCGEPWFGMDRVTQQEVTVGRVALEPGHEVMGKILSDEATYFLAYP